MITYFNKFLLENKSENLTIIPDNSLHDSGYNIDFEIMLDGEHIGKCEVNTIFKKEDFDYVKDDSYFSKNIGDSTNPIQKSYYNDDKYFFIIYIEEIEIEEEYRGNGYGYESMLIIIDYMNKHFPKNKGIFLSVLDNNIPAIKIYKKLGFNIFRKDNNVLEMKKG
jgi:ribosomal protein S18 acetylase RimI-like enzyme